MDEYSKIKQLCDENGIKMSALAEGIGVRGSVFTELKMGRTKRLSVGTLEKIAEYFQVPISYFSQSDTSDSVEQLSEDLFLKRKLLFDLSKKATAEDLDKIIKIVDALVGE